MGCSIKGARRVVGSWMKFGTNAAYDGCHVMQTHDDLDAGHSQTKHKKAREDLHGVHIRARRTEPSFRGTGLEDKKSIKPDFYYHLSSKEYSIN